jgi:DNA-binding SARP family transcriptional activator
MSRYRRSAAEQPDPKRASKELEVVRISLLGGFRVSVGSRSIGEVDWRLKKAASLIKLLALAPDHRLHREQVVELLWPGLDRKAAVNNLHQALHSARRTLRPRGAAPSSLRLRGELLELSPDDPLWVDVEAFEEEAATARRSCEPAAYRAAVRLYTGDLLPEDRYEDWVEGRREELRLSYLGLLVEMAGLYEERGEYGPAVEALQEAVATEPTHEEAHVGLMRLYARTGQRYRALRQYEQLGRALGRELDADPEARSRRLYEEILAGRIPTVIEALPVASAEPPGADKHNLPGSLTSFIGREREGEKVKQLLETTRLLTLSGVGGSGKTRLALEVARSLVGVYPDGVWLVELAPLADPELVPKAVASALGLPEQPNRQLTETLVDALRSKRMLLVLDNCEHLVEVCAGLAETLLSPCPGLQILATSRETLGAAGEVVWRVSPLSWPGSQRRRTAEELLGYESVRLFVERARHRDPAFALTEQNADTVAQICRRLEGIPLAIELAAASIGTMSAEQIAARFGDLLRLLTGGSRTALPRQRALRGTLDWSYVLLPEPERKLFGRLSVFAGGCTLEAAEEVCSGEGIGEKGRV